MQSMVHSSSFHSVSDTDSVIFDNSATSLGISSYERLNLV